MINVRKIKEKVINGYSITKEEAMSLYQQDLFELSRAANEIREVFLQNNFDICTIINAKNGKCSEDCKFCAQSSQSKAKINNYPLLSNDEIYEDAKRCYKQGITRYSIVTSGRKLSDFEIERMCEVISKIKKEIGISICASFGLQNITNLKKLKKAGLDRIHNNIETSKKHFNNICTTHSFIDKIETIKKAQEVGLYVCSGGIVGLNEDYIDVIDMAYVLRDLKIMSIPINILYPITGTPFENNKIITYDKIIRTIAIIRFINPKAYIRLAGGRNLLADMGESCFKSGANATITNNMLNTSGFSVESDLKLIKKLGFKLVSINE